MDRDRAGGLRELIGRAGGGGAQVGMGGRDIVEIVCCNA